MATNYKVISTSALIEKFKYALNNSWGYIWGTAGEMWTASKQAALNKTTDADRAKGREYGSKWIGRYVADCSGLFHWAFKQLGSYMYHGSNTMWNKYCVSQGELRKGKRTDGLVLKPGTAVFTYNAAKKNRGHVGLYIGDGWVIEAKGTIAGVIRSKITDSKWVEWGELRRVDYDNASSSPSVDQGIGEAVKDKKYPTLRRGDTGEYVRILQQLLAKSGSSLEIDGIFGPGTQSAVRAFQQRNNLTVDGIVGPQTWGALKKI